MKIPWPGNQCIICLEGGTLSAEHVIPEALGGVLECKFLCKTCNNRFGLGFEAKAKTDPAIRLAVANLKSEIPNIYSLVEDGQEYVAHSGPARVKAAFRKGEIRPKTCRLNDGSLMVPIKDAPGHIERMLTRDGHDTDFVRQALTAFGSASEGKEIEVSRNVSAINWPTHKVELDLSSSVPLSELLLVKIAYEFLALMSGSALCNDTLQLNEIRHVLRCNKRESDAFQIERLFAPQYAPFHGLCFEENDPYVKIQIRLFGKLAYRVHFRRLGFNGPKIVYTHNLKSREEDVREYGAEPHKSQRG
ncbi:MAG TPA: HNH endonuclease [Xanthobacteraceae bacterium]|nr:HNH endonuclease [Xanthobacteraceae bacterium]